MSTTVLAGDLPERNRSAVRFQGFGASDLPALAKLEPETVEPQSAPAPAEAVRPFRWPGSRPGVMAGKRPPRWPSAPVGCH